MFFSTDFLDICRDEKCPRDEIHAPHGVVRRAPRRGSFTITKRQLIREATFNAIGDRVLKPFAAVYTDVVDDYGHIKERTVFRALAELVEARRVAAVGPAGSGERLRTGGFVKGGYIRYDSPLLWSPGGVESLIDQADELRLEMIGFRSRRLVEDLTASPHSGGGGRNVVLLDVNTFEFAVN